MLRNPHDAAPRIGFPGVPESKVVKNREHVDLMAAGDLWRDEVGRVEGLGARSVRCVEEHVEARMVMHDSERNEFRHARW